MDRLRVRMVGRGRQDWYPAGEGGGGKIGVGGGGSGSGSGGGKAGKVGSSNRQTMLEGSLAAVWVLRRSSSVGDNT